jgi:cysteine desulfurase/selenocysteine lyase
VDRIQALGATPLDAREADFLVAASYKWLLGAHGVGILYVNQRLHRDLAPSYVGWRSVVDAYAEDRLSRYTLHPDARRFEEAMPNYLGLYVLEASLQGILDIGVEKIAQHNESLVDRLMAGYAELGIVLLTPTDGARRASIVAIEEPHCVGIARQLGDEGFIVWGKGGRIRVAPHFFNNLVDIERYLDVFARIKRFR